MWDRLTVTTYESLNHFRTKRGRCVCVCKYTCMYVYICIYIYIYMIIYIYVCVCDHIYMCVCVIFAMLLRGFAYHFARIFSQARLYKMDETLCPLNVTKSINHSIYSPSICINISMYLLSYQYLYQYILSLWIQTLSEKVLKPPNYSKLYSKHFLRRYLDPYNVGKTIINHPPNDHFYRWYVYYSQSWVVYGIVLPTLMGLSWDNNGITMGLSWDIIGILYIYIYNGTIFPGIPAPCFSESASEYLSHYPR